jgi:hypothetical protein
MRYAHAKNSIILFLIWKERRRIDAKLPSLDVFASRCGARGTAMENRVISVSLNEREWQALMRLHPQPVLWLREKIQESLQQANDAIASASAAGAMNTTSATTR